MSRVFGGVSTDKCLVAHHTGIDNLNTFSVSVWLLRTGSGGAGNGRVIQKGTGAGQTEWQWFDNNASANTTFQVVRWNTTTGTWTYARSGSNWEHHLITYNAGSTTNNPLAYINGATSAVTRATAPAGTLSTTTTADFVIGNDPTGVRNWAGRHMHVAYWNRILSAGEARTVYRQGPWRVASGLVLYLPLWGQASPEPNYVVQGNATHAGTLTGTTVGANNGLVLLGAA